MKIRQRDWHIHTFGQGPVTIIALHGYGFDGRQFAALSRALGEGYRILAPDFPFHGQTPANKACYTREYLRELLQELIDAAELENYILLGHSMGARVALCLARSLRPRPAHLFLIGPYLPLGLPDRIASRMPSRFIRLLERFTYSPAPWLGLAAWLHRRRLLPTSAYHFFVENAADAPGRARLFATWQFLVQLKSWNLAAKIRRDNGLGLTLVYGTEDGLFTKTQRKYWRKMLGAGQLNTYEGEHKPDWKAIAGKLREIRLSAPV